MEYSEKECFINIQSFMVRKLGLKGNELIIYAMIHGFSQDGHSFFYGSLKYIMQNTNLSKETVLSVLQNLVKKKLIVKKDVKNRNFLDRQKEAQGNRHFCLYYTSYSRNSDSAPQETCRLENTGSRNLTGKDCENASEESYRSRNLTGGSRENACEDRKNTPEETYGSRNLTGTGQEIRPNNKFDNKDDINSSASTADLKETEKTEAEDWIKNKIKDLFQGHYVFDSNFIPDILALSEQFKLEKEQIPEYLQFVLTKAERKKPDSLTNMYYKMAKSANIMQDFVLKTAQTKRQNSPLELEPCPVCKTQANILLRCPACNFDMTKRQNTGEVNFERQIFLLPEFQKKSLDEEIRQELERQNSFGFKRILQNPELKAEFKRKLDEIYRKYGITAA